MRKKEIFGSCPPQKYRQKRDSENGHRGQHGENEGTILENFELP